MKKVLHLALMCLLMFNIAEAQTTRAKIVNEPVTPHSLTTLGLTTNSVSPGLDVVAKGTYVYLSAKNIGGTDTVQSTTFTFNSRPGGSTATLTPFGTKWAYFQADVTGQYEVKVVMTTATGTDDTTRVITAATYKGVGNFEGVAATSGQCMSCHSAIQGARFTAIFDRWKVSGHANIFKEQIIAGDHYSSSCMKCHTTGMDHNVVSNNNGFDDVAASLGWSYTPPSSQAKWDSLKTHFSSLVNFATIGCENCHGPGSEHANTFGASKVPGNLEAGMCAQCHDEPWRHNKYAEYENSLHSEALWSSSFAQGSSSQNNGLGNCIRCHDAKGFINFTNGVTTNTTGMVEANHVAITCQTCHDPHGNSNVASLRTVPASSDTLGNGYAYTVGGLGQTCMACHKARRDVTAYTASGTVNSHWGPHHSVQTDVLLGQNAATFGSTPYLSNGAHKFIENTCVTCHMSESPANGNENRDKVGGHTFGLHNEENGYSHTVSCTSCHGPKENFESSFTAVSDFDGDGSVESVRSEIDGLVHTLKMYLPPVGQDSIDYAAINTTTLRKAYWNYQLIAYDGSGGMHNSKFAIDVLTKSIVAIGGVVPVQMTAFTVEANGNTVMLNWETATEINNKGFEVERKINKSFEKIAFISGNGTTSEVKNYSYSDKLNYSGKISYRIKQIDFDGTVSYSKEIEVELAVPAEYNLSQNYPNPFNPSTKFTYSIPVDSRVKVQIYNISGELVKELVNTNQSAGKYEVEFSTNSASNLSSGIYFFSVEATAGDGSKTFKQTKKMVLLK